jgi:hypothetical protein
MKPIPKLVSIFLKSKLHKEYNLPLIAFNHDDFVEMAATLKLKKMRIKSVTFVRGSIIEHDYFPYSAGDFTSDLSEICKAVYSSYSPAEIMNKYIIRLKKKASPAICRRAEIKNPDIEMIVLPARRRARRYNKPKTRAKNILLGRNIEFY